MNTKLIKLESDTRLQVIEDTQYVLEFSDFAKDKSYSLTLDFEKESVRAEVIAIYRLVGDEYLDFKTSAVHHVPHTACQTTVRGVLLGKAFSKYVGEIVIEKPAQQTSSFLRDDVLLLGDQTLSRSDPTLRIEADDVSASHGATTGGVDESQVYYLMSRGLSRDEACNVIVQGFLEGLLEQIHDESIRKKVKSMV